jgi:hypothetical protein
MIRRPQFRLSTLLWITLAVACWFGGMRYERWLAWSVWEDLPGPYREEDENPFAGIRWPWSLKSSDGTDPFLPDAKAGDEAQPLGNVP